MPTPYQLDFLSELNNQKDVEAYAYFLASKEENRDWKLGLDEAHTRIAGFSHILKDYIKFYRFFKKLSPDVVLVGGYSLPLSNLAFILTKLNKSKFYYWLERPFPCGRIKEMVKNIYFKLKLPIADGIFGIGKLATEIYERYSRTVYNLPYSLNLEKFYSINHEPHQKINFLFSGQLINRKNVVNLVSAFKGISPEISNLTIIGSGNLRIELEKIIGDAENIKLLGFVEPSALQKVFKDSDVFVLPSMFDGFPVVILEAMAAGMPIISAANVGSAVEYIQHEKNGYICALSSESIRDGLNYYIERPRKITEQGLINREIIINSLANTKNAVKYFLGKVHKKS